MWNPGPNDSLRAKIIPNRNSSEADGAQSQPSLQGEAGNEEEEQELTSGCLSNALPIFLMAIDRRTPAT